MAARWLTGDSNLVRSVIHGNSKAGLGGDIIIIPSPVASDPSFVVNSCKTTEPNLNIACQRNVICATDSRSILTSIKGYSFRSNAVWRCIRKRRNNPMLNIMATAMIRDKIFFRVLIAIPLFRFFRRNFLRTFPCHRCVLRW